MNTMRGWVKYVRHANKTLTHLAGGGLGGREEQEATHIGWGLNYPDANDDGHVKMETACWWCYRKAYAVTKIKTVFSQDMLVRFKNCQTEDWLKSLTVTYRTCLIILFWQKLGIYKISYIWFLHSSQYNYPDSCYTFHHLYGFTLF